MRPDWMPSWRVRNPTKSICVRCWKPLCHIQDEIGSKSNIRVILEEDKNAADKAKAFCVRGNDSRLGQIFVIWWIMPAPLRRREARCAFVLPMMGHGSKSPWMMTGRVFRLKMCRAF